MTKLFSKGNLTLMIMQFHKMLRLTGILKCILKKKDMSPLVGIRETRKPPGKRSFK